ncbi:hypothetical protein N7517_009640 [Penicillium concentricum]|uniref:Amino acid permease/ SLC12A domain-containing protein n=1 Tax=Penicillium concentricum TaxID=293559 RepID=A0A9W9RJJ0_9EURO|nr:uncharacterized protein N7517_009640 [Penicillium concentricum]KAJ5360449.1 hypothetical protein N7517_009640 [Penicillium concentricum]
MEHVESYSEFINHEFVDESNAGPHPEATNSFAVADDDILGAQGHDAVFKRSFSIVASLGFAFNITNAWVGALSNFGQNLRYGGSQVALFSVIIACFVQWIITLGLSELASAFPSSGGQYHFVYIIAPQKHKRFAAFVTGWMSILGWWMVTCSGLSLVAKAALGLGQFLHPDFEIKQWQEYCVLGDFAAIYGLIYLASTTAFNSIITFAVTLLNLSYAIPQAILVTRGRARCLPKRPLDLGRWGYIWNVLASLWIIVVGVMVCFPPNLPVTLGSMNYSAPVLVGLCLIILVFWGLIGDEFKGPNIDWEMLNLKNEAPSDGSTGIVEPNIIWTNSLNL